MTHLIPNCTDGRGCAVPRLRIQRAIADKGSLHNTAIAFTAEGNRGVVQGTLIGNGALNAQSGDGASATVRTIWNEVRHEKVPACKRGRPGAGRGFGSSRRPPAPTANAGEGVGLCNAAL